jgi:NAD+ synthase
VRPHETQAYALAAHLGVPDEIRRRLPTTGTLSMPQSQEESHFPLAYDKMDRCLYWRSHGVAPADGAAGIGLTAEQAERVYRDIDQRRRTAASLHLKPLFAESSPKVGR